MKSIAWLIAFSLAAGSLSAQELPVAGKTAHVWSLQTPQAPQNTYSYSAKEIDTSQYCLAEKPMRIEDRCVSDWSGFSSKSEMPEQASRVEAAPRRYGKAPYVYNFRAHVSGSAGVKLSEMSISKIRAEVELDTKTDHWTAGALLSAYTLQYYYTGFRAEAFARFYFAENTSGDGAFLQGRLGWGRFWDSKSSASFGGGGFGLDIGKKFIIVGNDRDFSNSFTMTPMGGIQAYPGPDGSIPVAWVWQLRFGYQFGGGRK